MADEIRPFYRLISLFLRARISLRRTTPYQATQTERKLRQHKATAQRSPNSPRVFLKFCPSDPRPRVAAAYHTPPKRARVSCAQPIGGTYCPLRALAVVSIAKQPH